MKIWFTQTEIAKIMVRGLKSEFEPPGVAQKIEELADLFDECAMSRAALGRPGEETYDDAEWLDSFAAILRDELLATEQCPECECFPGDGYTPTCTTCTNTRKELEG